MSQSVVVIGAGLAGLSAGCYAAMNGYEPRIYERQASSGGVAMAWRRGDFTIDGGIHFVMPPQPASGSPTLYDELGVTRCRFRPYDVFCRFIDEAAGRTLDVTADLDLLASDLKDGAPCDGALIDELIAGGRAFRGLPADIGMDAPAELRGRLGGLRDMWAARRALRYFGGRYGASVEEYASAAQSPWLRNVLHHLFLPEAPVWFILMLLGAMADRNVAAVEGGSPALVGAVERRYRELGGAVTHGAHVEGILVENDRAAGIRLADGTVERADVVISAADGYSTIYEMLGGRYADAATDARYRDWPLFRPMLMVSLGVAMDLSDDAPLKTITFEEPLRVAGEAVGSAYVRVFSYCPAFAPAGKSVIQAEIETEWEYWNDLQGSDRGAYEAEKSRLACDVLSRLERYWPGIGGRVEMTDVATPYTTWRYTRNRRGSFEGWMPVGRNMLTPIPRTLPGLAGFYMAGQWVMPGGGVTPSLYSGRHAIQLLCRDDRRTFVTTGVDA